ncbi:NAD(P)-dependent oxidoreductase [Nocardia yunnanensis]|uniref:NAD(P)-dependent oxidoreductase n=1 Tax=Nocardia yunnanensis TaxID=2382165 RepID=A0A386ZP12_9NOCA|nr:NAD-dependent epimerase/dehydratase family protein [Nocardia yunnanensis]AYF78439.1 NAD(P)-dependent oxidoreductase [Nocardia yunnanensis]
MSSTEIRNSRPTVLVTGVTGAVGRHLVDTLLARGAAVRARPGVSTSSSMPPWPPACAAS